MGSTSDFNGRIHQRGSRLGGLPPGCNDADFERGVSRLDDYPPGRLWKLLDERRQADLYRQFFQREWAELSAVLDDHATVDHRAAVAHRARADARLGEAFHSLWLAWRDTAVRRMALDGLISIQS